MGVSGGEEGARNGPSMMPGGTPDAYAYVEAVLKKVAAQVDDGPCVTYVGPGGAGNFVKMVHNGIEYGDMQLIAEAYDILKSLGGYSNQEISEIFADWNAKELSSFLMEISSVILAKEDDQPGKSGSLVDQILDKTGMKGTGKWTIQQAAELSVAAPTMASALDGRFLSGLKDQRVEAAQFYAARGLGEVAPLAGAARDQLREDVKAALYSSKICSYAQGMNIIRAKSAAQDWGIDLGECARIWKGGCIIRAVFLNDIKQAYDRDPALPNLLLDGFFADAIVGNQAAWRTSTPSAATGSPPTSCRPSGTSSAPTPTSASTWRGGTTPSGPTPRARTPSPPRATRRSARCRGGRGGGLYESVPDRSISRFDDVFFIQEISFYYSEQALG